MNAPTSPPIIPRLRMRGITKRYGAVVANDGVDLDVARGGIHAIVGENGAGKTTLMRIAYGLTQPDEGVYELNGQEVHLSSPAAAIALGIGMVHQRFQLVDELSVLENLVLGRAPRRFGVAFDRRAALSRAKKLEIQLGTSLPWERPVRTLGVGARQRLEIMRLLYQQADLLIFDEPTSVLTPREADDLFVIMRRLAADGRTIVFITHKLREVFAVSDRVTVMRRGRVVADSPASGTDPATVGAQIVGEPLEGGQHAAPGNPGVAVLEVRALHVGNDAGEMVLNGASLEVRAGEIVGLAGVEGNGQRELVEALMGIRRSLSGTVVIRGQTCTDAGVHARRRLGLGFISEDRDREGASLDESLADNAIALCYRDAGFARHGVLQRRIIFETTQRLLDQFGVRGGGPRSTARSLSGGNLQRLIVGRELRDAPGVLIASHPTRGVDMRGIAFIHQQLLQARDRGAGILLISEELFQMLEVCDRIAVIFQGRIVADLSAATATAEQLGALMTGVAV